jgi:phosphoribosylformylglycinamidine synthase
MERDPFWGAASAMDEVIRNLAAVGARISSVCDNLNFGNPEDPDVMMHLEEATRGLAHVARPLGIPFSSGNVSLYNEGVTGPVPPTPTLLGIGIVDDLRQCTSSDLKAAGNALFLVGRDTARELGGSEYLAVLDVPDAGSVPRMEPAEAIRVAEAVVTAGQAGLSRSVHDVAEGGLAVAACEMAFGGDVGFEIDAALIAKDLRADVALFSETNTRYLIEVAAKDVQAFEDHMRRHEVAARRIGQTAGQRIVIRHGERRLVDLRLDEARRAWEEPVHRFMG